MQYVAADIHILQYIYARECVVIVVEGCLNGLRVQCNVLRVSRNFGLDTHKCILFLVYPD